MPEGTNEKEGVEFDDDLGCDRKMKLVSVFTSYLVIIIARSQPGALFKRPVERETCPI